MWNKFRFWSVLWLFLIAKPVSAGLPETIQSIQPSVVGIGTYSRTLAQHTRFLGTGFAVLNGKFIVTNAHVIPTLLHSNQKEKIVIFAGRGKNPNIRDAEIVTIDLTYDIAILKISGKALKPVTLSNRKVREGESIAFTGFPIGAILGLYPVTHHGIISCITPIAVPVRTTKELTVKQLIRLKNPYLVYQLDATAYPGNSGSPVYEPETGKVIAIINKVLVKSTKEALLSDPSAITYAIPVIYLKHILKKVSLSH
ncbi:S1 family peptidase [Vibrio salinus]|uniref:S1 family peptidase n=1 Tax=Vibrio salinus TaxID=2899784 RepID=UPI001E429F83|nr:serine protease [Vibrio salinus]MCE0493280.1 serine protease [Vibrio salinus]